MIRCSPCGGLSPDGSTNCVRCSRKLTEEGALERLIIDGPIRCSCGTMNEARAPNCRGCPRQLSLVTNDRPVEWLTRLDIKLTGLGFVLGSKYLGELIALARFLSVGELPEAIVPGRAGGGGMFNDVDALLTATDRRIIFIEVGRLGREQVADFPYSDLAGVQARMGMVAGSVAFQSHGRDHNFPTFHSVPSAKLITFVEVCRAKIQEARLLPEQGAAPQGGVGLVGELERLAMLHEKGLIDEAEFQVLKKKLLADE